MDLQVFVFFGGLLALWSGIIIATLKWMLDKSDRHMGERLELLNKHIETFRSDVHKLELEVERVKREAVERFVPREDWIQFGIAMEGKLDRVVRKIDAAVR